MIIHTYFALNKVSAENFLCITRLENVLQVLALVGLGWRLCPTNRAFTCKMAFSSFVIHITTYLTYKKVYFRLMLLSIFLRLLCSF
jgi:hypothetical protein